MIGPKGLQRLLGDVRGAVAPLASLFIMVLAPLSGMAVDYVYAESAKRALQEAVDSALLAVARANPSSQAEIDRIGARFFAANLDERYDFKNVSLRITRVDDGSYRGGATGDVSLFFSGLFGQSGMTAGVDGSVNLNLTDLEVVLALDTTGSMMGQKLTGLKTAANGFITAMSRGDNVRTGIVPFARYVNIGMGNRNAPGFDIPADSRSCRQEMVWENYNCRNCRRTPRSGTCYNDGTPYTCTWTDTQCDCDRRQVQRTVCNNQTWNGCVGSRPEPFNTRDDNPNVKIPGLLNRSCGAPLTRLTRNESQLRASINGLVATGETYIPSGLSMGWATLSHRIPFADGSDPSATGNRNLLRAIVLMTDGANTASKRSGRPDHEGSNVGDANAVTRQLCENIKGDDVLLFTVAFEVNDASIKNLLRSCATAPAYAFEANNSAQLNDAFEDIAVALSRLRLTE
jgi:Flp pilus assembly protein TadG